MTKRGLLKARDLKLSDQVLDDKGAFRALTVVKRFPIQKDEFVWNLELETASAYGRDHRLRANGVVISSGRSPRIRNNQTKQLVKMWRKA